MPAAPLAAPPPAPTRPPWAIGRSVALVDVLLAYRDALRSIAWREGEEPDIEVRIPQWAMRVCALSRRGRSPHLRAWLEWCAAGESEAPRRALLIDNIARLMRPEEALRAIQQMIHQGGM